MISILYNLYLAKQPIRAEFLEFLEFLEFQNSIQ